MVVFMAPTTIEEGVGQPRSYLPQIQPISESQRWPLNTRAGRSIEMRLNALGQPLSDPMGYAGDP